LAVAYMKLTRHGRNERRQTRPIADAGWQNRWIRIWCSRLCAARSQPDGETTTNAIGIAAASPVDSSSPWRVGRDGSSVHDFCRPGMSDGVASANRHDDGLAREAHWVSREAARAMRAIARRRSLPPVACADQGISGRSVQMNLDGCNGPRAEVTDRDVESTTFIVRREIRPGPRFSAPGAISRSTSLSDRPGQSRSARESVEARRSAERPREHATACLSETQDGERRASSVAADARDSSYARRGSSRRAVSEGCALGCVRCSARGSRCTHCRRTDRQAPRNRRRYTRRSVC